MSKLALLLVAVLLFGYAVYAVYGNASEVAFSDVKDDETIVFFRTTAWLDEASQQWHVPIHGWIYEPEDSSARKAVLTQILKSRYDLEPDEDTDANYSRRLNLLIADNERGKRIVISIAGQQHTLPASSSNGHFEAVLTFPEADFAAFSDGALLPYAAVMSDGDSRSFTGEVRLVTPHGMSVVSDIDDTVKITAVTDRRSMLENTFLLDFQAAPGMAALYGEWARHGASYHYVSSSPWQLYSPLQEFLDAADFPWSSFSLKLVRFRDETLFDLFKKGTETKPPAIEAILNRYPGRQFVLVGDSGEQDPEVYADLFRRYSEQIRKIYIRNVSNEAADNERFQSVFAGIDPDCWALFDDPAGLRLPQLIPELDPTP